MEEKKLITWICKECGDRYGRRPVGVATWHIDICDVCGKESVLVTEPRDFGGINPEKINKLIKTKEDEK